jgi:peroxiredoxin
MKLKDLLIGGFALAVVAALAFFWLAPGGGLKAAPDVSVTTLEGKTIQLAQLRGRPVLVTFWATSCPGCVKEMPQMVELYKELAPKGFEIIAIAMAYDPPAQVREMAARRELPYTVAIDSDGAAAKAFGDVQLTPTHFLIDPQGRIVQQKLGDFEPVQMRERILGLLGNA